MSKRTNGYKICQMIDFRTLTTHDGLLVVGGGVVGGGVVGGGVVVIGVGMLVVV